MHGIVMKALKDFVVEEYDAATWRAIQREAGLGGKLYVPVSEYDDVEALALVGAASDLSGEDRSDLLYAFGRYIVEPLVETYVHEALRAKRLSEFAPPELRAKRVDDDVAVVRYGSDRELCDLAEGIVDGVGAYYRESYEVSHETCMNEGDPHCDLVVRRVPLEEAAT